MVYTGDEHHNGAQVVDIDGDGDLDIISIGWSHDRVLLYENKAIRGDTDGLVAFDPKTLLEMVNEEERCVTINLA